MVNEEKIKKFLSEVGTEKEESLVEMMLLLVRTLEERDPYTKGHSERVAVLAVMMASQLGFENRDLERIRRGALLHDIGKIGIRDEILNKAGSFTQDERARMNKHPEKGHFIAINSHLLWDLIPIIRNHHENFDGTGYPDHLQGEDIPIEARIVSLSDYFDALATRRPYKDAFPKEKSLSFVRDMSGKKFDPKVVEALLSVVDVFYEKYIIPANTEPFVDEY